MTDAPTPHPNRHRPSRHLWRQRLAAVSLLALAAGGAWVAAGWATDRIEARAAAEVSAALRAGGFDWARAEADGLALILSGRAPDEVQRFRAVSAAGIVVDADRLKDRIEIALPADATPPPFRLEILRHENGVSVIGLAPAGLDRAAMLARLAGGDDEPAGEGQAGEGQKAQISDLVELADYPTPAHWDAAVDFALTASALAPRGKVSVSAEGVSVAAVTDGPAEKARLEQALEAALPQGVTLTTDITAPRPVIAPFVLALDKTGGGLRMTACAADTAAARDRITAALAEAGLPGQPDCTLGLGAPSPQWADAAVPAIAALAALPAGRVEIRDTEVTLTAPALVPAGQFDRARDGLRAALPRMFALTATLERAQPALPAGPALFSASVTPDGAALQGAIADDRMRAAVESFATARFGGIDGNLTANAAVPSGWSLRVIGTLEALAALDRGTAEVTPDLIRLQGATGSRDAADQLAATLAARVGAGADYELALRYDPRLDPAVDLPSGTACVDSLNETMQQSEIGFEPARAVIAGDPVGTLVRLGQIMSRCGDFRMEIGGHTDSQGSDSFNMTLSRDRAQAVAEAMADAGIAVQNLTVAGYGETRPVGDNATEAGREMNRRIEFRLLSPDPVNVTPEPVTVVRGTTRAVAEAAPEAGTGDRAGDGVDAAGTPPAPSLPDDAAAGALPPEQGDVVPDEASADSAAGTEDTAQAADSAPAGTAPAGTAGDGGGTSPASDDNAAAPAAPATSSAVPAAAAPSPAAPVSATPVDAADMDAPVPLRPGPVQTGRLSGLPPDLGGEAPPLLPVPDATVAPVPDAETITITPDDFAASEGISIRPQAPEIVGDRLLTPVPPVLPTGIPVAPAAAGDATPRPMPRPDN